MSVDCNKLQKKHTALQLIVMFVDLACNILYCCIDSYCNIDGIIAIYNITDCVRHFEHISSCTYCTGIGGQEQLIWMEILGQDTI
jgi:hypothetical protein